MRIEAILSNETQVCDQQKVPVSHCQCGLRAQGTLLGVYYNTNLPLDSRDSSHKSESIWKTNYVWNVTDGCRRC